MKKGGAAKGELVLAMYELANCFRNGWGVEKDPIAARQYYETAANLGDTDAMNECAWCYLEGFGGKKDKVLFSFFSLLENPSFPKSLGLYGDTSASSRRDYENDLNQTICLPICDAPDITSAQR
jgi:TPR repeat protein